MLFCVSSNAFSDRIASPVVKQRPPIECTDSDNYDQTDCAKALELRQWIKNQENSPDKKFLIATIGNDVLIEKKSGYRIGLHKIKKVGDKNDSVAIKIGILGQTQMFVIDAVCNIGNSIKVLKNTSDFTLFRSACTATDQHGKINDSFNYYNFDKHYKRLDVLFQYEEKQVNEPTQTFSSGLYKFLWRNYSNGNERPFSKYYDYKITGNRSGDLKCVRAWDDDAGCNIGFVTPISSGQYRVLDE